MLFSDGPLFSRMFAWRSAVLVNRTRSGPKSFCALPRKRYRFWRLSVLRYATQLSYIFHNCHCTFVTTLLRLFICLLLNLPVRKRALFAELLWSDFSRPLRFPVRLNSIYSAQHVHWYSGVYNEFSFLRLRNGWCWVTPNLGRWEKSRFVLSIEH